MDVDLKNSLDIRVARATLAFAASANVVGLDLGANDDIGQALLIFNIGAFTAGSSPTYDASLQSGSLSDGSDAVAFSPAIAIAQATGASHQVLQVDTRAMTGRYLKIVQTLGGTSTPSAPVGITLVARKQVQP